MAEVKILLEGSHSLVNDKVYINSTVTLVKSENKRILVDTSHLWDKGKLLMALKKENLFPGDIDIVILTHTHLDHTANLHLFSKAKIFAKFIGSYPGQLHNISEKCIERHEIKDGTKITKDVEFLFTPGHSIDSLSVVVKTDKGIVVVSGDAIASEHFADINNNPEEFLLYNLKKYKKSKQKILKIADWVIPGHGKMFKNENI